MTPTICGAHVKSARLRSRCSSWVSAQGRHRRSSQVLAERDQGRHRRCCVAAVSSRRHVEALKQALKNRVDAAEEAGCLTEAQAKELKARIDSVEFCPAPARRSSARVRTSTALRALRGSHRCLRPRMTEVELPTRSRTRRSPRSPGEGKSVPGSSPPEAAQEKWIAAAVADGRLTVAGVGLKAHLEDRTRPSSTVSFATFDGATGVSPGPAPRAPPVFGREPA